MKRNTVIGFLIVSYLIATLAFATLQNNFIADKNYLAFSLLCVLSGLVCAVSTHTISKRYGAFMALYAAIIYAIPTTFATMFSVYDWVIQHNPTPFIAWISQFILLCSIGVFLTRSAHLKALTN